jgi:SAM-dependent methyltransferase
VTRGRGLLEPFLARIRASKADALIGKHLREGRVLDIGCGTFPYFLTHTYFEQKFAIDQLSNNQHTSGIEWYQLDLNAALALPFENGFFSSVSMLAVVEHLNPASLETLFSEVYRILIPGGILVITTPAAWSNSLLNWMASVNLVSEEEIKEHVFLYTLPLLGWYFGKSGFDMNKLRFGYFELFLNMWATAEK